MLHTILNTEYLRRKIAKSIDQYKTKKNDNDNFFFKT